MELDRRLDGTFQAVHLRRHSMFLAVVHWAIVARQLGQWWTYRGRFMERGVTLVAMHRLYDRLDDFR